MGSIPLVFDGREFQTNRSRSKIAMIYILVAVLFFLKQFSVQRTIILSSFDVTYHSTVSTLHHFEYVTNNIIWTEAISQKNFIPDIGLSAKQPIIPEKVEFSNLHNQRFPASSNVINA